MKNQKRSRKEKLQAFRAAYNKNIDELKRLAKERGSVFPVRSRLSKDEASRIMDSSDEAEVIEIDFRQKKLKLAA